VRKKNIMTSETKEKFRPLEKLYADAKALHKEYKERVNTCLMELKQMRIDKVVDDLSGEIDNDIAKLNEEINMTMELVISSYDRMVKIKRSMLENTVNNTLTSIKTMVNDIYAGETTVDIGACDGGYMCSHIVTVFEKKKRVIDTNLTAPEICHVFMKYKLEVPQHFQHWLNCNVLLL